MNLIAPESRSREFRRPSTGDRAGVAALVMCSFLLCPGAAPALEPLTDFHRTFAWTTYGTELGRAGFEILEPSSGGAPLLLVTHARIDPFDFDSRAYVLALSNGRFRQVATSFLHGAEGLRSAAPWRSPTTGRILLTSWSFVRVVEASDWTEVVEIPLPLDNAQAALVGDLLSAPGDELAVCDPDDLHVFSYPAGDPLLTRSGFGCRALRLFQRDSDPELELLLSGNPLGIMALGGPSLSVEWADPAGRSAHVEILDLDGDGDVELIYGLALPDEDPAIAAGLRATDSRENVVLWEDPAVRFEHLSVGPPETALRLLLATETGLEYRTAADGAPAGSLPGWTRQVRRALVADLDRDGRLEAILVTPTEPWSQLDEIVAVDLSSGEILATSEDIYGPIGTLGVGDFDADGDPELATITLSRVSNVARWTFLDRSTHEIEYLEPAEPYQERAYGGLATIQMDGDPRPEICGFREDFLSITSYLRCEDPLTHETQLEYTFPEGHQGSVLAIADLDGDQEEEIVATTTYGGVLVFDSGTGDLRWGVLEAGANVSGNRLRIGDLDADAAKEIVVGGSTTCCDAAIVVYDDGTESLEYGPFTLTDHTFEIAPRSGGPGNDLLVSGESHTIRALDLSSGELSAPIASYAGPVNSIRAADVTRDGVVDWVVLVEDRIVVRDGALGADIWTGPDLGWESSYPPFAEALWVEEGPGQAPPWIYASLREGIIAFEAPLIPVFLDGFESGDTGAWSEVMP